METSMKMNVQRRTTLKAARRGGDLSGLGISPPSHDSTTRTYAGRATINTEIATLGCVDACVAGPVAPPPPSSGLNPRSRASQEVCVREVAKCATRICAAAFTMLQAAAVPAPALGVLRLARHAPLAPAPWAPPPGPRPAGNFSSSSNCCRLWSAGSGVGAALARSARHSTASGACSSVMTARTQLHVRNSALMYAKEAQRMPGTCCRWRRRRVAMARRLRPTTTRAPRR